MQERKKYTMELTQQQAESLQKLINATSFVSEVKFEEVKEVAEEVDEREETIKSIKCYMQSCDKGYEYCNGCQYDTSLSQHRVNEIALKHIQGYKNTMEWINEQLIKTTDLYLINHLKAFRNIMLKEFNISEVDNGTEID